ncbi:MAG: hypothetical protein K2Q12_11125 [Rickettsiales bacterium]|nr:hypothetical protein [Rickettsiales bacterium]
MTGVQEGGNANGQQPPAGGDTATGGQQGGGAQAHDFRHSLPDDLKGLHPEIKDTTALMKSYASLTEKMGTAINLPKEGDEAATNDFYNKIGRPESPDKYDFTKFEQVNPDIAKAFAPAAHKAGLTQKQVETLTEWNLNLANDIKAADNAKAEASLKQAWGAEYDKKFGEVQAWAKAQFPDAVVQKYGADADFIAGIRGIYERFAVEGDIRHGDKGAGVNTLAEAQAKAAEIRSNPAFNDPMNPQHKQIKQEFDSIYARIATLQKKG